VNDGEGFLVVERLEGRERGMEAEEAVEVEEGFGGLGESGAEWGVVIVAEGNDGGEPVHGAALEYDDEDVPGVRGGGGAGEPSGGGAEAEGGYGGVLEEKAACGHGEVLAVSVVGIPGRHRRGRRLPGG
jgi:hypothetical protein